jgi:hypothetical protein
LYQRPITKKTSVRFLSIHKKERILYSANKTISRIKEILLLH